MTPTSDSSDSTFDHTKARTKTGDPIRPSPHEENGEASKSHPCLGKMKLVGFGSWYRLNPSKFSDAEFIAKQGETDQIRT